MCNNACICVIIHPCICNSMYTGNNMCTGGCILIFLYLRGYVLLGVRGVLYKHLYIKGV